MYCEAKLYKKNQKIAGKFCLTNFRFYFKSDVSSILLAFLIYYFGLNLIFLSRKKDYYKDPSIEEQKGEPTDEYLMPEYLVEDVPLGLIQKIEKISSQLNSIDFLGFSVICKVDILKVTYLKS